MIWKRALLLGLLTITGLVITTRESDGPLILHIAFTQLSTTSRHAIERFVSERVLSDAEAESPSNFRGHRSMPRDQDPTITGTKRKPSRKASSDPRLSRLRRPHDMPVEELERS